MIRKVDVGSVFGTAQRTSYEYMKLLNEKTNGNFRADAYDKDGFYSLPFATHGSKVVMYEPNEVYIKGGVIDDITITPITNRRYFKENESKIEIRNTNFYESKIEDKYDFVYCYRSLHESHNKKIPMKRKIRKLLYSIKDDEIKQLTRDIKEDLFKKNKNCSKKNIITNSLTSKTYMNKTKIRNVVRNINDEMEKTSEEFSKLFNYGKERSDSL